MAQNFEGIPSLLKRCGIWCQKSVKCGKVWATVTLTGNARLRGDQLLQELAASRRGLCKSTGIVGGVPLAGNPTMTPWRQKTLNSLFP